MSVLPLMPSSIPGKWDMISPSQLAYKMDRPTYSTPAPVENIPANNECRMVEVMGSKVASFTLDGDDYICLPQAFELFLKHLVGGLHTVYTKLKRLSITPVVCNVEQVRILRGIGAIQPGVNRCKLITKGDFETLYQDCTTASRPGRPPKRYPLLPLSADMMTQQSNPGSNNKEFKQSLKDNLRRSMSSTRIGVNHTNQTLMNQSNFASMQKRIRLSHSSDLSCDDRVNSSPTKSSEKCFPPTNLPMMSPDIHGNTNTNFAYIQALRQQYQQVSALSGLQTGLDVQSSPLNPALAQILMMSNPALFPTALPPTSIAMLNHFNQQIAQQQGANVTLSSGRLSTGNEERASSRFSQNSEHNRELTLSPRPDKTSDNEGLSSPKLDIDQSKPTTNIEQVNSGIVASLIKDRVESECSGKTLKEGFTFSANSLSDAVRNMRNTSDLVSRNDDLKSDKLNIPPTQSLITQIQGLLKLAASSASAQENQYMSEIEKLKAKLKEEKMLRAVAQQKLDNCEKERAETEKQLCLAKEERKKLNTRLFSMQHLLNHNNENLSEGIDVKMTPSNPSSPLSQDQDQNDSHSENSSSSTIPSSDLSTRIETVSPSTPTASSPPNFNTNNNSSPEHLQSPDYTKRLLVTGQQRLFSNPLLFQSAAIQ